ncbi:hypothetical protein HMPREF1141_3551 [Clostridium sp. MSTE9]|nr:hypothetical protein HMPREF1141_3551 [Clostridium sp. MSTE9]
MKGYCYIISIRSAFDLFKGEEFFCVTNFADQIRSPHACAGALS